MRRCQKLTQKQIEELRNIVSNTQSSGKEVRRAQAVLLLNQGEKIEIITNLTGYSYRQTFDLRKNYLEKGIEAIRDKRKKNPKELLTKKQKEEITKILKTKTPLDLAYLDNYWTTGILGDFIEQKYNVKYKSKTSYYLIFRQARFTYHKPGRVYHQRDEEEVRKWRKNTKPIIEKAQKEPDTVPLTEDEMLLSTQTTIQKIWLPQGEYPKIEVSNKRENKSIYGFLNIKTGKEHAFKTNKQNMYITTRVLKKLRKIYPYQKLLLLWDSAGWHKGSKVQEFIKKDKNIEVIHFPKYAPEENPQEHVWKSGRNKITHNKFIKNIDNATNEFVDYLNNTKFHYSLLEG